jgi:hypothetical protein
MRNFIIYTIHQLIIIRMIKSRRGMGDTRNVCKLFIVTHEWMRPLARSRLRWKNNIKMHLKKRGCLD